MKVSRHPFSLVWLVFLLHVVSPAAIAGETSDPGWLAEARVARAEWKRAQPQLFQAISAILYAADPIGVGSRISAPRDVYDAETATLIPTLKYSNSAREVQDYVHQEFVRWFDAKAAGNRDGYADIGAKVWEVWRRHRASMPFDSAYFAAMKEPLLVVDAKSPQAFVLRFTWERSWHDPIAVRVWRDGAAFNMRAVRLSPWRDAGKRKIASDISRTLTKGETVELQRLMSADGLWQPFNQNEKKAVAAELDGATWTFERLDGEAYSAFELWGPTYYDHESQRRPDVDYTKVRDMHAFVNIGLYLLKINGLTPKDPEDIY